MNVSRKQKPQARLNVNHEGLPMATIQDPTRIDRHQVSFYDDGEEKFLQRELLRAKLRSEPYKSADNIVPEASDLETFTRKHIKTLQGMSRGSEVEQLELKLLKRQFNSHSLFNIATKLAEAELIDRERNELKTFWRSDVKYNGASKRSERRKALMPGDASGGGGGGGKGAAI